MSCELSACLDPSVRPSIMKMPSPKTYLFQLALHEKDESSHETPVVPSCSRKDEDSDVTYKAPVKRMCYEAAKELSSKIMREHVACSDKLKYLNEYCSVKKKSLLPPNYRKVFCNFAVDFDGAFYVPSHRIIICSYADNRTLYCDHHGLGRSIQENKPGLPHMVLTGECAKAVTRYYKEEDNPIPYLSSKDFKTSLIQNVPLSDGKTCAWCVDFCYLR